MSEIRLFMFSLVRCQHTASLFFFFNDTATTEIYTLSLHDALPILCGPRRGADRHSRGGRRAPAADQGAREHPEVRRSRDRSEEHTSELQSRLHLLFRLLLVKKKNRLDTNVHCAFPVLRQFQ